MKKKKGPLTMDKLYGDGSNHLACKKCGACITCGDCECNKKHLSIFNNHEKF